MSSCFPYSTQSQTLSKVRARAQLPCNGLGSITYNHTVHLLATSIVFILINTLLSLHEGLLFTPNANSPCPCARRNEFGHALLLALLHRHPNHLRRVLPAVCPRGFGVPGGCVAGGCVWVSAALLEWLKTAGSHCAGHVLPSLVNACCIYVVVECFT